MAEQSNRFRDDPLLRGSAPVVLGAARACMDEYALEIFDLWFSGEAPCQVVFDSPKWAAYMQADKGLTRQVDEHMADFALKFRDKHFCKKDVRISQGPILQNRPYRTHLDAVVGSRDGGLCTGYSQ